MRYNDVRKGTNEVGQVLEKYKDAWALKGMPSENGFFRNAYRVKQDQLVNATDIDFTAWYASTPLPQATFSFHEIDIFNQGMRHDELVELSPNARNAPFPLHRLPNPHP
jgi:hypothetical protein